MSFPPVRACLFDLDGTLIDTEDINTDCINKVVTQHPGATTIPSSLRALILGVPGIIKNQQFCEWLASQVPPTSLPPQAFQDQFRKLARTRYVDCKFLPGVVPLLRTLSTITTVSLPDDTAEEKLEIAMVTSSSGKMFQRKTQRHQAIFDNTFQPTRRFVGDDARRGKKPRQEPAQETYLTALEFINKERAASGKGKPIRANECLAFEDSMPGVEAAMRAGMRVVCIPNRMVRETYKLKEGMVWQGDAMQTGAKRGHCTERRSAWENWVPKRELPPSEWRAEIKISLVNFNFASYGIAT